jgi:hypothetical protein
MNILKIIKIRESNYKEPFNVELPDDSKIVGVNEDGIRTRIYCLIGDDNQDTTTSNYEVQWINEGDSIPDKFTLIGISYRHDKLLFNTGKVQPITKMTTY